MKESDGMNNMIGMADVASKKTGKEHKFLDNLKLRTKMLILCIMCVLVPVIGTSVVFWNMVYRAEAERFESQMDDACTNTVKNLDDLSHTLSVMTATFYTDETIYRFLDERYDDASDFYNAYRTSFGPSGVVYGNNTYINKIELYADNDTLINGGGVQKISTAIDRNWYKDYNKTRKASQVYAYYDATAQNNNNRVISLIRSLDFTKYNSKRNKKFLKIDVSYGYCSRALIKQDSTIDVYICQDDKILFSGAEPSSVVLPFRQVSEIDVTKADRAFEYDIFGSKWQIYMFRSGETGISVSETIVERWPILLVLLLINLIIPFTAVYLVSASISGRLRLLAGHLDMVKEERFEEIEMQPSKDELGDLVENYNLMTQKMRELIEDVYKAKLSNQEKELQRQRAELQALHSQINPHFMFNSLESIRMRSLIKGENETADIIEKLAIMMRRSTDWCDDLLTVGDEVNFAETYLKLQQYRFSNRLSYKINLSPECEKYLIPKLSIVTFVENACVHGVEGVTRNCIIIISVERSGEDLCIYVEDTGAGMSEEQSAKIISEMRDVTFDTILSSKSIGIINACLRLKRSFGDDVRFELDSEEGTGSCFTIKIPISQLNSEER